MIDKRMIKMKRQKVLKTDLGVLEKLDEYRKEVLETNGLKRLLVKFDLDIRAGKDVTELQLHLNLKCMIDTCLKLLLTTLAMYDTDSGGDQLSYVVWEAKLPAREVPVTVLEISYPTSKIGGSKGKHYPIKPFFFIIGCTADSDSLLENLPAGLGSQFTIVNLPVHYHTQGISYENIIDVVDMVCWRAGGSLSNKIKNN